MKLRKPGEVWLADLGIAAKVRPVVVVSRADPDPPRALYLYVPLTTQDRGSAYEVPLGKLEFMHQESTANVQGLGSLPDSRFTRKLGELLPGQLEDLRGAIRFALDM